MDSKLKFTLPPVCIALALALVPQTADAVAIRPGFDTFTLPANDDGSAGPVDIGFEVNFFGFHATQLFVNNNGNVTFEEDLSTFTPFDLTSTGAKIIAPFFADVDTSGAGSEVTFGQGIVDGRLAFGANWIDVDYFESDPSHTNRNSFQLVLINRPDTGNLNFDIEFNFDQIQWETGEASDGEADGRGGSSARVGFSNGSGDEGTFFELDGSAINGAFLDDGPADTALIHNSLNSIVPGRYIFFSRNGALTAVALGSEYDGLTAQTDLGYLVSRHQLMALRDQAMTVGSTPTRAASIALTSPLLDQKSNYQMSMLDDYTSTEISDAKSMVLALAPQAQWQVGDRVSAFASGQIADGDMGAKDGTPAHDYRIKTVTGGVRFVITDKIMGGVAVGWSDGETQTKGTSTPTKIDVEGRSASAFAMMDLNNNRYVSAAVGYQDLEYETHRFIGPDTFADATTDGTVIFAGLEAGWTQQVGQYAIGPIATVDYFHIDMDGFTETGAGSANVTVADSDGGMFAASIGVQASTTWQDEQLTLTPFGRAALAGRWGDEVAAATGFAGTALNSVSIRAERDDVWLDIGAGMRAKLHDANGLRVDATVEYTGVLLNNDYEEHGGRLLFSVYF